MHVACDHVTIRHEDSPYPCNNSEMIARNSWHNNEAATQMVSCQIAGIRPFDPLLFLLQIIICVHVPYQNGAHGWLAVMMNM